MSSDPISTTSNDHNLSRVLSHQSENRDGFFQSYSFPPKNNQLQKNSPNSHQTNPFERINSVQPPTKPYRSMSVPGVFPLRRRQSSASPLSKISYSQETKDEPSIIKSQNDSFSHLRRASVGGDPNHPISFNYRRRLSNPGSFSLKHDRQPSPLGTRASITIRSHSNSVSSSVSSGYFSDLSELTSQSTSINESELINSDVGHPNQFRNMSSKSKPSPLGSRRPLSIGNSLLSTIDDELSVTPE